MFRYCTRDQVQLCPEGILSARDHFDAVQHPAYMTLAVPLSEVRRRRNEPCSR